jgi:hypothetical protein
LTEQSKLRVESARSKSGAPELESDLREGR